MTDIRILHKVISHTHTHSRVYTQTHAHAHIYHTTHAEQYAMKKKHHALANANARPHLFSKPIEPYFFISIHRSLELVPFCSAFVLAFFLSSLTLPPADSTPQRHLHQGRVRNQRASVPYFGAVCAPLFILLFALGLLTALPLSQQCVI